MPDGDQSGRPHRKLWSTVGRHAALVGVAMVGLKALGFVEKQLVAYQFGTGPRAEAYFVLTGLMMSVAIVVRELTEPVMLPLFVSRYCDGEQRPAAWGLFRLFCLGALAATLPIAAALTAWPASVVRLMAPGLSAAAVAGASELLRVGAAGVVLLSLGMVAQAALNGTERFGLPAATDLAYRSTLIAGCWLAGGEKVGMVAIAYGAVVGGALRVGWQLSALPAGALLARTSAYRPRGELRASAAAVWPLVLGVLLGQLGDLAATHYASKAGPGLMAARLFAQKVIDLPILLLPYVLSVVSFPYLARLAAQGEWDQLNRLVAPAARWALVLFVPAALLLHVLAEPIVVLLFQRGRFDALAARATADIFSVYALGLPAFALDALLVPVFFALRDLRTPVLIGAGAVALNVATMALLDGPGGPRAAAGVAGALVLSKSLKVVTLAALLARRRIHVGRPLVRGGIQSLLCAAAALLLAFQLPMATWLGQPGPWRKVGALGATLLVFTVSYTAAQVAVRRASARRHHPTDPEGDGCR